MDNEIINITAVALVAAALKNLKEKMVFVGGAVLSVYIDDPAADEVRPTDDIDLTLNIVNLGQWEKLQEDLMKLGFHPDPFGHAICSYKYKDIPVDIMGTDDGPLGPSNHWYKPGLEHLWKVKVKDQEINILSAPYYLASKFEAFHNRGKDYRTSHDIEDIIYLIDNRTTILDEMRSCDQKMKVFLKQEFQQLINLGQLTEVLIAHIHPIMVEERLPLVENKIKLILEA